MSATTRHILVSRAALLCSCAVVFIATLVGLCGPNSLACVAVLTSDGAVALGWMLGACALGAVILRPIKTEVNRALFVASAGGLGLGVFSLLALGLGLLGWLNQWVAIAFPALSIVLFVIDLIRRHPGMIDRNAMERWLREPAGANWLWLVPVISLAIACVSASIMPGILWKSLGDPHPYDVTGYHLLVPREWYELGRIVPLDHNVFSYFPFNVEMQFLLLMHAMGGPWAGMYACQFVSVGHSVLLVLAVFGAGNKDERRTSNVELRTSKSNHSSLQSSTFDVRRSTFAFSSIIAACFAAIVPWVIMLAGVAYVESGLMLYTALSIAWALQAIRQPGRLITNLILSGIMAGLACGVKITAVPMLLLAVPTAIYLVFTFERKMSRRVLTGCAGLVFAGSIVLSPWLIRNFAWSGNPLFPIGMKVLGQDHFTDQQVERFRVAHSPTPAQKPIASRLRILWKEVIAHWQFDFVLFPIAIAALAIRWRDPQMWLLAVCGLFVLMVWIGFTHLLPRFLVMLIPIAAMAIGQIRWNWAWPAAVMFVLVGAGLGWNSIVPALYAQSDPPPYHGEPGFAFIGNSPDVLMDPPLAKARDDHMQIGLVGDAQAFLYDIPMSQMHYRTVFNLQPGDPIDAWVGSKVKGDPNWFLVINPAEIDRLNRTYRFVPALPPDWAAQGNQPFYLHANHLGDP